MVSKTAVRSASADLDAHWWDHAVVYQVYLRSFRDGNGDGVGDLQGLKAGLTYIAELGCDAIWLNPCYVSPGLDHGYDVADYFSIDPAYGTLDDFDEMLAQAHELGLRVLMDMVANHCSSEHPWFQRALHSARGSAVRERFLFRDGRGSSGELPPNNWQSVFGGAAWTRINEPDGAPGQWYLHSFDADQPDFNWRNPDVTDHFQDVLRFWFDRGVDGFRIDVAHGHVKADGLPDHPGLDDGSGGHNFAMWDQPEVHDIYRSWRAIGDTYEPKKFFVGEIWVPSKDQMVQYLRDDELHSAFYFDLLVQPWDAGRLRAAIDLGLSTHPQPVAWTLGNHDVHRVVTRYGQDQDDCDVDPTDMIAAARRRGPVDVQRGLRRARAATALLLALPGSVYLYQGEELGLPEVLDLPDSARQDPIWRRSSGRELGRDGCRVPIPWDERSPSFGFSLRQDARPWLPQPSWFGDFTQQGQVGDPDSMLSLYRKLLRLRSVLYRGDAQLEWLEQRDGVVAFGRGMASCVVNCSESSFELPPEWQLGSRVVSTEAMEGELLPHDSAAWFTRT